MELNRVEMEYGIIDVYDDEIITSFSITHHSKCLVLYRCDRLIIDKQILEIQS